MKHKAQYQLLPKELKLLEYKKLRHVLSLSWFDWGWEILI
jgi:hypothetical protein